MLSPSKDESPKVLPAGSQELMALEALTRLRSIHSIYLKWPCHFRAKGLLSVSKLTELKLCLNYLTQTNKVQPPWPSVTLLLRDDQKGTHLQEGHYLGCSLHLISYEHLHMGRRICSEISIQVPKNLFLPQPCER